MRTRASSPVRRTSPAVSFSGLHRERGRRHRVGLGAGAAIGAAADDEAVLAGRVALGRAGASRSRRRRRRARWCRGSRRRCATVLQPPFFRSRALDLDERRAARSVERRVAAVPGERHAGVAREGRGGLGHDGAGLRRLPRRRAGGALAPVGGGSGAPAGASWPAASASARPTATSRYRAPWWRPKSVKLPSYAHASYSSGVAVYET